MRFTIDKQKNKKIKTKITAYSSLSTLPRWINPHFHGKESPPQTRKIPQRVSGIIFWTKRKEKESTESTYASADRSRRVALESIGTFPRSTWNPKFDLSVCLPACRSNSPAQLRATVEEEEKWRSSTELQAAWQKHPINWGIYVTQGREWIT